LKLYAIFLVPWIIAIFFGLPVISPNSDDIFYLLPAVGFAEHGILAVPLGDQQFWKILFNLPTYAFFQGIIFSLINVADIPINFTTYRLPHSIIVLCFVLISSLLLIKNSKSNTLSYRYFLPILFLGLLGLLPFVQVWPVFRPEPLGLVVFISGFWLLEAGLIEDKIIKKSIPGSLLIGISPTLHPLFAVVFALSMFTFTIKLLIDKKIFRALYLTILSLIPLIILSSYVYLITPEAITVIQEQSTLATEGRRAFSGLFQRIHETVFTNFNWSKSVVSIYTLFFLILIFLFIFSSIIALKNIFLTSNNHDTSLNGFLIIGASSLISLFFIFDFSYAHSTMSALLLLSTIGLNKNIILKFFEKLPKQLKFFLLLTLFLTPLSWTILNYSKHILKPEYYLKPDALLKTLENRNVIFDNLFVISHELAPIVIDKLIHPDKNKTYWLFPDVGQVLKNPKLEQFKVNFIDNKIDNSTSLWLTKSKNTSQGYSIISDGSLCISIDNATQLNTGSYFVKIAEPQILYNSHRYKLIKGKRVKGICNVPRGNY
tara:strand:- start:162 stop:1793 length:1632 start_codon:yes stop_codon:yes gene_type:complete